LNTRKSNIDSIQKAAKDVMERSDEDTSLLQAQLIDLTTKWDKVSSLSANKRQRLSDAYTEVWHLLYQQQQPQSCQYSTHYGTC